MKRGKKGQKIKEYTFQNYVQHTCLLTSHTYPIACYIYRYIVMHASTINKPPLPNKICRTRCYAVKSPTAQTVSWPMPGLISYTRVTRV